MSALSQQQNETCRSRRTPARMEKLAKLPVFWDLEGKKVLIAGASDAAAWKAELMAACGAFVSVYLSEATPCRILTQLAENNCQITLHRCKWRAADLSAFALAIGDCDDDAEAHDFFSAARIAGVPVNVIDKPAYCQFQFGSIVNRSPVVIAISTDGAAPILAQAIRRRIETLLPQALGSWAALARKLRKEVARLDAGTPRRRFWENFVDLAFKGNATPGPADEKRLLDAIDGISKFAITASNRVTYVGAGPGEAEMLTLKAVRTLQAADVIIYDADIVGDVLELARREAKRLFVRDCGEDQRSLANTIIALANSGKRVVRLVGGDACLSPDIAGETVCLAKSGVVVDYVRGVQCEDTGTRDVDLYLKMHCNVILCGILA